MENKKRTFFFSLRGKKLHRREKKPSPPIEGLLNEKSSIVFDTKSIIPTIRDNVIPFDS